MSNARSPNLKKILDFSAQRLYTVKMENEEEYHEGWMAFELNPEDEPHMGHSREYTEGWYDAAEEAGYGLG